MKQLGSSRGRGLLWSGTSLMTLAIFAATGAQAQTAPEAVASPTAAPQADSGSQTPDDNDILIVGVRRALGDAAETKRNAATIVD